MLKNVVYSCGIAVDEKEDIVYSFIYGKPVFDGEGENRLFNFLITNKQEATHCLITISTETSNNEDMWTLTNLIKDDYDPLYDEYDYGDSEDEEYIMNYAAVIDKELAEELEDKCFK